VANTEKELESFRRFLSYKTRTVVWDTKPAFTRKGKTDMSACFIGIDVSKDRLDIAIRPTNESMSCTNDDEGIDLLIKRLQPLQPDLIVMEATGSYHQLVLGRLLGVGFYGNCSQSTPGTRLCPSNRSVGKNRQDRLACLGRIR
jgi:hypothetical protein